MCPQAQDQKEGGKPRVWRRVHLGVGHQAGHGSSALGGIDRGASLSEEAWAGFPAQ